MRFLDASAILAPMGLDPGLDPMGAKLAQPCFDSIFFEAVHGGAVAIV
jgi:hypothetical protein